MARRSEQLRRETDECRAQLTGTLEELRDSMTPGRVVDEAVDYARDTALGDFFQNLKTQMRRDPLPVTLIGAGLAWLMWSNGRARQADVVGSMRGSSLSGRVSSSTGALGEQASQAAASARVRASAQGSLWSERASDAASSIEERASETASSLGESAAQTTAAWRDRGASAIQSSAEAADRASAHISELAASAYGSTSDAAGRLAQRASDTASAAMQSVSDSAATLRDRASSAGDNAARAMSQAGRRMTDFLEQQPLVLGGIALAIGAALGAGLPRTRTEDRLMGEASDAIKEQAAKVAGDQVEQAKATAEHAYEAAKQAIGGNDEKTQPAGIDPVALGVGPAADR